MIVDGNTTNACQGLYHLKRLRETKARDTYAKSMVNITHIESNNGLNHPKPIITPHLGLVAAMRSDAALCDLQCVCGYWQLLRQWGVDRFLEAGGLGEVSAAGTSAGSAGKSSTPPPASRLWFWRLQVWSTRLHLYVQHEISATSLPANEGAVFCEHSPWCSESPVWQVQFVYLWRASEILCRSVPVGVRYHSGSMLHQWLHSCSSFFSSVATKFFYVERAICHQPHGERLEIWGAHYWIASWWFWAASLSSNTSFYSAYLIVLPLLELVRNTCKMLTNTSCQRKSYPESDRLNASTTSMLSENLSPDTSPAAGFIMYSVSIHRTVLPKCQKYSNAPEKNHQSRNCTNAWRYRFWTMKVHYLITITDPFDHFARWKTKLFYRTELHSNHSSLLPYFGSLHWGLHILNDMGSQGPSGRKSGRLRSKNMCNLWHYNTWNFFRYHGCPNISCFCNELQTYDVHIRTT